MSVSAAVRPLPYWTLSGYYFFYFAFIGAFSPYFGLYLQGQGFSAWDIALLLSQMQVMRLFGPTLWGWLSDRSGRRIGIVRLAAVLSCIGLAGGFHVSSFSGWLLVIAVMAFFWSAALPLVETMTLEHLAERPSQYSRIRLWGSIGFIVAVLATGWALDRMPLAGLLWVLLALLLGIWLVALRLWERPMAALNDTPNIGWRQVLAEPRVQALLAACFCMSAAHGALYVFYSIYLDGLGYSRTLVGGLWSLGVIAEIGVFLIMGRLLRRYSLRQILLACLVAATLRFLLIGWGASSLPLLVFAQLLHGLSFGAYHAASIGAVKEWFPARFQGRGQALYSSVSFGAGGLLGGIVSGALWAPLGGAVTYTVGAAFAFIGAMFLVRLMPSPTPANEA
jgi:PPP family 3-phenylpropionic acid transporter